MTITLHLDSSIVRAEQYKEYRSRTRDIQTSPLILDGRYIKVYWDDGDTFRIIRPKYGNKARLHGYNTLENYGPVHKWGKWDEHDLFEVGNRATSVARSKQWRCYTMKGSGGYGRILVNCPELAKALIIQGLAHVFSMGTSGDPKLLALQRKAIQKHQGIWAKGVPSQIITSVHSATGKYRYGLNRLISTLTGGSEIHQHKRRYRTCQWICMRGSCMMYIPHRLRYPPRKASCLERDQDK
jgi:endonuclease YncB( thermonuclease family)